MMKDSIKDNDANRYYLFERDKHENKDWDVFLDRKEKKHLWRYEILEKIDDEIEQWHNSDIDIPLHEYLGMTEKEYAKWVELKEER